MSRVRADRFTNRSGSGAPKLTHGAEIPVGYGITGAGFINISGVSTFSSDVTLEGNVSIGGTLTYEDVTNVDSVGLITARDGIRVTNGSIKVGSATTIESGSIDITGAVEVNGGIDVTGIVTATSFSGNGADLVGIRPSYQATASGTLSDGSIVVVNADGTVGIATTTNVTISANVGTETTFNNGATSHISAVYDPINKKVVVAYRDESNSNKGTLVVGTMTGPGNDTISFGNEFIFYDSDVVYTSCSYDTSKDLVVIAFRDNLLSDSYVVLAEVSANGNVGFSSAFEFDQGAGNGNATFITSAYSPVTKRTLIAAVRSVPQQAYATAGVITGDNISNYEMHFGPSYDFATGGQQPWWLNMAYSPSADIFGVVYRDYVPNPKVGRMELLSVDINGAVTRLTNSIQFTQGNTVDSEKPTIAFHPTNNKFIVAYNDLGTSPASKGFVQLGTVVNGNTVSLVNNLTMDTGVVKSPKITYNDALDKFYVQYEVGSNNKYIEVDLEPGTNNLQLGSATIIDTANSPDFNFNFYNPDTKTHLFLYEDQDDSDKGYCRAVSLPGSYTDTNLTEENYIGISAGAYTNGQTATIQTVGSVDDAQSGLTTGRKYYVRNDGTLNLKPGTPSVFAGTSVSDTKIIVKG